MKTTEINTLIEELDRKVNQYVNEKNLFNGGCCWSAYVLAKGLEELGIHYDVVLYQGYSEECCNMRRFNKAVNSDGCAHVAIRVTYKHRKVLIGDCYGLERCLNVRRNLLGEPWLTRTYTTPKSADLLVAYLNGDWNEKWDTSYNEDFRYDISHIFAKYVK